MTFDEYKETVKSCGLQIFLQDGLYRDKGETLSICGYREKARYTKKDVGKYCTKEIYLNENWKNGSMILFDLKKGTYINGQYTTNKEKAAKMILAVIKQIKKDKIELELKKIDEDFKL
jgi:hypothetical protein